jgi:hypothetical protein
VFFSHFFSLAASLQRKKIKEQQKLTDCFSDIDALLNILDADSKDVNVVLWVTTWRQAAQAAIICTADIAGKFLCEEEAGAIVLTANESRD